MDQQLFSTKMTNDLESNTVKALWQYNTIVYSHVHFYILLQVFIYLEKGNCIVVKKNSKI